MLSGSGAAASGEAAGAFSGGVSSSPPAGAPPAQGLSTPGSRAPPSGLGGPTGYEVPHSFAPPGIDAVVTDELPDAATGTPAPALKSAVTTLRDVKAFLRLPTHSNGASVRAGGLLSASTFALTFTPSGPLPLALRHLPRSYMTVPVATIRRI